MIKQIFTILGLFIVSNLYGQNFGGHGHLNPDSLELVTFTGVTIIDENSVHPIYYLDVDGDTNADYHLSFAPFWYAPDSSNALRPLNGDAITVTGGLHDDSGMNENTIVVYEINGEFWRDPFYAAWNNMGRHNHYMGSHHDGGQGYGFGIDHDTVITVELNGIAIIDTTFYFGHYYLDVDADTQPDYFLNFGPCWYEPESGAERPSSGESITIIGGVLENNEATPMLIVYQINGVEWRDSLALGNHFGGGWMHSANDTISFHSPFDNMDRLTFHSGWKNGGMHGHGGGSLPDSLFCQFFEVYPNNIPNLDNHKVLAGYEVNMYFPNGSNGMWDNGRMGNHMSLGSNVEFMFHYTDSQLNFSGVNENNIGVKYWDNQGENWVEIQNATINTESNTISFSNEEVSSYIILFDNQSATSISDQKQIIPDNFALNQNYPNPFNPSTNIEFSIKTQGNYSIKIFNIIGQEVATLTNKVYAPGNYKVNWDAGKLTSGIYIYQLSGNNVLLSRKMILVK